MSFFTRKNDKECKGDSLPCKVDWLAIDIKHRQYSIVLAQTYKEALDRACAKLHALDAKDVVVLPGFKEAS